MANLVQRIQVYVQQHGLSYTIYRAGEKGAERLLKRYHRWWMEHRTSEEELARQRKNPIDAGLISVIVPVYNTDPDMLMEMAQSVMEQTYPHWEAILYDDCSTKQETQEMLKKIAAMDDRFHVHRGEKNQGISGGSNSAIALAAGEWIALLDHDDLITPDALYCVAKAIIDEKPDLIYSDEDKVTENGKTHTDPHFKPDFCPDNLRSGNYFCHLMVLKKELIERAGGFRQAFNGSQDHDLALRCSELAGKIVHIPKVLYHWRTVGTSVSHQNLMKCVNAACAAVQEHMGRIGWPGTTESHLGNIRMRYEIKGNPAVGIYIFGNDEAELDRCKTAMEAASWENKKVITVKAAPAERYAAMNRVAQSAREDVLLMMDASVQVTDAAFVEELLMYAQRDDVGAVTPELTDRKGKITHGGFAVGMEHLVQCRQEKLPYHSGGWHLLMQTSHNVAAVSAACVMIRRDHFIPFDEGYHGDLGAADWSLRLAEKGLRHVFTPHARAVCEDRELLLLGKKRNTEDAARYAKHWPDVKDPCYSGLFSKRTASYKLK